MVFVTGGYVGYVVQHPDPQTLNIAILIALYIFGNGLATFAQWIIVGSLENGQYEKMSDRRKSFIYGTGTLAGMMAGLSYTLTFWKESQNVRDSITFMCGLLLAMIVAGSMGASAIRLYTSKFDGIVIKREEKNGT